MKNNVFESLNSIFYIQKLNDFKRETYYVADNN